MGVPSGHVKDPHARRPGGHRLHPNGGDECLLAVPAVRAGRLRRRSFTARGMELFGLGFPQRNGTQSGCSSAGGEGQRTQAADRTQSGCAEVVGFDADVAASVARSRLDTIAAMTPLRAAGARACRGSRTKGARVTLKSTATSTRSRAAKAATAAELNACLSHCSPVCSDALSDALRLDLLARSAPRISSSLARVGRCGSSGAEASDSRKRE